MLFRGIVLLDGAHVALGIGLQRQIDALGLIDGLVEDEAQLGRHTPRLALCHNGADTALGLLERLGRLLVAFRLGRVEDVALAAVVTHLAARDGGVVQTRIGHVEEQDIGQDLARLLVDLA